jgi:hypothetical protein
MMTSGATCRRLAKRLRAAGLALVSLLCLALALRGGAAMAQTATGAVVRVLAQVIVVSTPAPAGSAAPSSAPSPAPGRHRPSNGGPLTFSLTGGLSLGTMSQQQTRGQSSTGIQQTSSSTTHETAGIQAMVQRRTVSTTLQLGLPLGLAFHQSTNFGQVTAGYYTPEYGVLYGPQTFALLGGVPLGATIRGYAFLLPLHGGDLTFFDGPAEGPNSQILSVAGVRGRLLVHDTLIELGADKAHAPDGSSVAALVFGVAHSSRTVTQSFESALEDDRAGDGTSGSGLSYQYRADFGSQSTYASFLARRVSDRFVAIGAGQLPADTYLSTSLRFSAGPNAMAIEEGFENNGSGEDLTHVRRGSFSIARTFERSGIQTQFALSEQRQQTQQGTYWIGSVQSQIGFTFLDTSALFGTQLQRASLSYGPAQSLVTYTGSLQRQFGVYSTGAIWQTTRLGGGESGLQSSGSVQLGRNFGATALTFSATATHSASPLDNLRQFAPTITIARRLSPVASVGVTYGVQTTHDLTNPANSGHNRIFSVQLAAPFAIGSGVVQGHADPRLPATISGSVMSDTGSSQMAYAGAINNGVGNVVVVMDDTVVQRTDLSGHYQFNFVTPGTHQVRLESSSLPRGVTVDQPYAQVAVQGGQTANLTFVIGTFGGIAGHVFARDTSGSAVPLGGVSLEMDGTAYAKTDPLGAYSFGRLAAGAHTVEIVDSSLPASAAFAKDAEKQKVSVKNGEITPLDFTADPLGSIAGVVTYAPDVAPDHTGPVMNAYVVANPGDYAAITNDDGSFLLDNIPPGTYTLDLDPETVPDGTANASGPVSVTLSGTENKEGLQFTVGKKQKAVVFTFKTTEAPAANLELSEPSLPPDGATQAVVDAGGPASSVSGTFMGKTYAFVYEAARKRWVATLVVPSQAAAGKETVLADVHIGNGQTTTVSADLTVSPDVPLFSFKMTPAHAGIGHYVTVRARFLADVHPGDSIRWLDGQITRLTHPVAGRIYMFSVKISERLMRGMLLTRQGQLPIILK